MAGNGQQAAAERACWQFMLESYRPAPEEQATLLARLRAWLAAPPARVFWKVDPVSLAEVGVMRRLVGLVLLGLVVAAVWVQMERRDEGIRATPTATQAPTVRPSPSVTPWPPQLPGLVPADILVNLEERGWTCSRDFGGSLLVWSCTLDTPGVLARVDVYSRGLGSVDFVEAGVMGEDGGELLGFLATWPYDGAQPAAARAWVLEHLHDEQAQAEFGGVRLWLRAPVGAWSLEMGELLE